MICLTLLLVTIAQYLGSSSGPPSTIFRTSNKGSLLLFNLRLMAKLNNKIEQWKLYLESPLIINRITKQSSYFCRNLFIIVQKILAQNIHLPNSTASNIHMFLGKKRSTPTLGPKQLIYSSKKLEIL